jgi:hypothetical protein
VYLYPLRQAVHEVEAAAVQVLQLALHAVQTPEAKKYPALHAVATEAVEQADAPAAQAVQTPAYEPDK